MIYTYIFILPIFIPIWILLTLIACYTIAVLNEHVIPIFPYVSDTGAWPPESSVFTFMIATAAVLLIFVFYIRYLQVKNYLLDSSPKLERVNLIALISGIAAGLGLIVAASFQETTILFVHLAGATAAFGLGTFYQSLQVYISIKIYPAIGYRIMNYFRLIFALFSFITSCVAGVFFVLAYLQFQGDNLTIWRQGDPGYENHLIGAIAESILVISTISFVATFIGEFRQFVLIEPRVLGKSKNNIPRVSYF